MNPVTPSSRDVSRRLAAPQAVPAEKLGAVPDRVTRYLRRACVGGIASALLIMIAASLVRNGWERPYIAVPGGGPPFDLRMHVSLVLVSIALWSAALLGGGGVVAGLIATRRGAPPPARVLLAMGVLAALALVMFLPTGSTDALDDAAYGRIAALGHSPYQVTPQQMVAVHDPIAMNTPNVWREQYTLYGPLATGEQWAAAELGSTSAARIVFWLKLWNALAFVTVAGVLDRMLRSDPARRARGHLLWSANPLLLWVLVSAGHVESLAVAAGFLGVAVARVVVPGGRLAATRWFAAGILVGASADVKIPYILFGLGVAWAARRSLKACLSAVSGAALVLLPGYLWFGIPAVVVLFKRDYLASVDNFYQLFVGSYGNTFPHQVTVGALLFGAVALGMLWRFPDAAPGLPAVRPTLALCIAWLMFWSYVLPWYDAMALCLLAFYPASRVDWVVLAQTVIGVFALMPGNAGVPHEHWLAHFTNACLYWVAPALLLVTAGFLVWLCATRRWNLRDPDLAQVSAR
jgi:hypothetical protein